MKKAISIFLGAAVLSFLNAGVVHATTYWPSGTAAYQDQCGTAVISGAKVTIVPSGGCSSIDIKSSFLSTVSGTTYYFVLSTTGTGHIQYQQSNGNGHTVLSNALASSTFSITANATGGYFQFGGGSTNWTSDMNGSVDSLCISDTSYSECSGSTPPPPPAPSIFSSSFGQLYTTASSTCTQTNTDHTATTTWMCYATSTQPTGVPYGDWLLVSSLMLFALAFIPVGTFYSLIKVKK